MTATYTDAKGLVWAAGGADTDDHLTFGGHEPNILMVARALLPEGGTFLDVGAHVGLYTLNLADKAGFVYAVEANEETFEVLQNNIAANVLKVTAGIARFCVAAWDKRSYLLLVDENDKPTGGSTRCIECPEEEANAYGVPLDEVLPHYRNIDLVKIDVEGAEARVLKGMQKRIMTDRPTLLIEMHDMYFGDQIRIDVLAFLEAFGYHWDDSLHHGGSYYIVAIPHDPDAEVIEIVKAGL